MKQNPGEAKLTLEEVHEMVSSGSYSKVMSKLMHYVKMLQGPVPIGTKQNNNLKQPLLN